ncbi:hypothetical protein [Halobacillus sp. BBL2006]|uniref:hypothetical protein n=1 Tax=Halobacillus sp. BBL2006 TaxID=1543706 RepID=UPI000543042D|nr:hypothetical protein [Halobacillus sp. BBL2006]KHE71013.1 hypothetical protein LD39_10680 [Halobacillus sp. BBL2006]
MNKWIFIALLIVSIGYFTIKSFGPDYTGEIIDKNLQDNGRHLLVRVEKAKGQGDIDSLWLKKNKEINNDQLKIGQHIKIWTADFLIETKPPIAYPEKLEAIKK